MKPFDIQIKEAKRLFKQAREIALGFGIVVWAGLKTTLKVLLPHPNQKAIRSVSYLRRASAKVQAPIVNTIPTRKLVVGKFEWKVSASVGQIEQYFFLCESDEILLTGALSVKVPSDGTYAIGWDRNEILLTLVDPSDKQLDTYLHKILDKPLNKPKELISLKDVMVMPPADPEILQDKTKVQLKDFDKQYGDFLKQVDKIVAEVKADQSRRMSSKLPTHTKAIKS